MWLVEIYPDSQDKSHFPKTFLESCGEANTKDIIRTIVNANAIHTVKVNSVRIVVRRSPVAVIFLKTKSIVKIISSCNTKC